MRNTRYFSALIFAVTAAPYLFSGLSGVFLFDDNTSIARNPAIMRFDPYSLQSWWSAAFDSPATLRPVSYLSFAVQWWFSPGNALPMQVVNILLHAASAVFIYLALCEGVTLREGREATPDERRLAVLGALLWALHPVQTQAVDYVVQRMTVLAGMFCFASFWLYLRARRGGNAGAYAASAGIWVVALLSKENAAVLPPVIVAWEFLLAPAENPERRVRRMGWIGAACMLPVLMAGIYGVISAEHFAIGTLPNRDFTLWQRMISAPRMYLRYASLLLWPHPLALDYGLSASSSLLSPWTTMPSFGALFAGLLAAVKWRQRWPIVSFSFLAFLLALMPETTFLNLELFYEHRLYLPGAFVLPLVPWGIGLLNSHFHGSRRMVAISMGMLITLAAGRTCLRNRDWVSEIVLLEKNAAVFPENGRVRENLGMALRATGRYEEAESQARAAVEITSDSAWAHMLLGELSIDQGRIAQGIESLQHAIEIDPTLIRARLTLSREFEKSGEHELAMRHALEAVATNEENPEARVYLGAALMGEGRVAEALNQFQTATQLDPLNHDAFYNLGVASVLLDDYARAVEAWRRADTLTPNQPKTMRNLGIAHGRLGQLGASAHYLKRACEAGDQQSCAAIHK